VINGGYAGKFLEVDLTTGRIGEFTLPEEVLRTWLGCSGLGLHLLAQELTPGLKATDAATPVFILAGPLTGTVVPSSSNWTIITLNGNANLPYAPCLSHGHGYFGARLKHAGWDGIAIRGASPSPVYLSIDNDEVELKDASHLWGGDTFETVRRVQIEEGDPANTSVACIGPAGETLLPGASVRADLAYGASRGAPGVVWGSKKLKAVAVRGSGRVPVHNLVALMDVSEEWKAAIEEFKYDQYMRPESGLTRAEVSGGAFGLRLMPGHGLDTRAPGKNFTEPECAIRWGENLGREMKQWKVAGVGSWNCDIQCHFEATVTTGSFAGLRYTGYAGEVIEVAPLLGVEDASTSMALAQYFDAIGVDASEPGLLVALAFEMYDKGLLNQEDTGGLDLRWGNHEAAMELVERMMRREGLGAILAKAPLEAARELGPEAEKMLVHIKGGGFNLHDNRAYGIGWLFGLIMGGAGPTWQARGAENRPEPDWGYPERMAGDSPDGKGTAAAVSHIKKMWLDCTGACFFTSSGMARSDREFLPKAIESAVGWDGFDFDEAKLVGERVVTLQRLINLSRGYTTEDDFNVGKAILEPIPSGPKKGWDLGPHFGGMRQDFYDHLGWDLVSGQPSAETLEKVGLGNYAIGRAR
jgi:aldehyde:ferredoxin oxidoreductase